MSRDRRPYSRDYDYRREGKVTVRRTGNRYTGSTITQREADTINRCISKILKIAQRDNLYAGDQFLLESAANVLSNALEQAGRA